jgi:hypothetical protein
VLRALVGRPAKERHAEVDGRGVEGVDRVAQIESQILADVQLPRALNQHLREVRIDAPIAKLVGVGKGAAADNAVHPHVIELPIERAQARDKVAQTLAEGELPEDQTQELIPAGKGADTIVALVPPDALLEFVAGKLVDQL